MKFPQQSIEFLSSLIQNNNREWFNERKSTYKSCKSLNKEFYDDVRFHLQEVDRIERIKPFRIYRDLRFTKDKTPYKTHYGVRFIRSGKQRRGTYYLHIAPDNQSFCAGGFYGPNKEDLFRIRKEFEIDDQPIRELLSSNEIKQRFPKGLEGDELKTSPRDFDINHPAIDLIRKKQFYLSTPFHDDDLSKENFSEIVAEHMLAMVPFLNYMSEVVTTDLNGRPIV